MNRQRFAYGLGTSLVSGILTVAILASTAWGLQDFSRLFYFVLPDWALIFWALVISGIAAVIGIALLVPPCIRRVSRDWLRLLIGVSAGIALAAVSVLWLFYFLSVGLNAISSTYTKVTAENGDSVIVEHSGFDLKNYSVFAQESPFLYQRSSRERSVSVVFQPNICSLDAEESNLLLTCGEDSVSVTPLER